MKTGEEKGTGRGEGIGDQAANNWGHKLIWGSIWSPDGYNSMSYGGSDPLEKGLG